MSLKVNRCLPSADVAAGIQAEIKVFRLDTCAEAAFNHSIHFYFRAPLFGSVLDQVCIYLSLAEKPDWNAEAVSAAAARSPRWQGAE